ncbi:hypothetical protein L596_001408 [Steinernema carpocapsae]|uniref:Uncharacterized protein n=1 Tax=Steinernema carpocapsae TaxID=34508 RepID=A0A4U8UNP4_STECR|nr:hypothetical protein L596_001408 [Steinernema carpocapsae]
MAANWLKNIGGQLTEFASEVMNEAQQEVDDPESELQVEKKKSADFEKQLHAEKAKTEVLEKQVKSLEDQMYTTNMEMDAISSRFQKMIDARDNQIKTMKSELYQYQVRAEEGELSPKVTGSADLERCAQLEHHLHEDQTKLDILVAKNRTLEDQLHRLNMDLGSLNILHQNSMDARDQQIESLKGEIEALQSWGEEVDLKSTTQAEPHDAAQQKIEELHNELRDANNKNEELEETITNLRDQIRHLRLKIQTNTINQTATSEANEREMTSLRDRNAELSALLDAQQRYGQEYQHLEAQLAEKTLCNDTLAEYIRKLEEQIYKTGHPSLVDLAVYDVVDKPESSENEAQSSNEEVVNESSEGPGPNTKANLLLELRIRSCRSKKRSMQRTLNWLNYERPKKRLEHCDQHNEIPHGTPTFEQVTERIFKEKIEKARAEVTHWKTIAGENGQAYYDEEIKKLQKALSGKELECDDQLAYILLNIETPTSHTAQADSHISNDELSEKLGRPKTTDLDNEQEIRKLRLELYELLKCFNELSTEYTRYKDQHESNPSSAMNREFTDRIDSLKASLIEYEERYEQCKRENSETVAQLEKLTADFEKLRFGVKSAGTDLAAENAQLKEKLNEALQDKEVLLNDSQKFQGTVNSIDKELERIRESNRNLHGENAELRVSLDGSRARVSESNEMLRGFRTELNEIRDAGESRVESARAVAAQLEAQRDALQAEVEGLRTKVEQNDGTIQRLRALVGDDGAHIEADHNDIDKVNN